MLLSNISTGVFLFNFPDFKCVLFFNYFREKSLHKKCNYKKTLEAKRRNKYRIQGICLDILCDVLFLTGAAVSIALFSNPVVLFITIPLITLGCVVMVEHNSLYLPSS